MLRWDSNPRLLYVRRVIYQLSYETTWWPNSSVGYKFRSQIFLTYCGKRRLTLFAENPQTTSQTSCRKLMGFTQKNGVWYQEAESKWFDGACGGHTVIIYGRLLDFFRHLKSTCLQHLVLCWKTTQKINFSIYLSIFIGRKVHLFWTVFQKILSSKYRYWTSLLQTTIPDIWYVCLKLL